MRQLNCSSLAGTMCSLPVVHLVGVKKQHTRDDIHLHIQCLAKGLNTISHYSRTIIIMSVICYALCSTDFLFKKLKCKAVVKINIYIQIM